MLQSITSTDRQWWFDARDLGEDDISVLNAAYQSNCGAILVDPDQQELVVTGKARVVYVHDADQLGRLAKDLWILTPDEALATRARQEGRKAGCFVQVADLEKEFPRCVEIVQRGHDFVVVQMDHATYIPFELLVAQARGTPTRILRSVPIRDLHGTVDEVSQALNAFGTLEQGVDVLFRSHSAADIKHLDGEIEERLRGQLPLVEAEVIEVQHTGLGHRACGETTPVL
jgi:3-dehydroquinate synthase class II